MMIDASFRTSAYFKYVDKIARTGLQIEVNGFIINNI